MYLYLCGGMCTWTQVLMEVRGIGSCGAVGIGSYELPAGGSGNWLESSARAVDATPPAIQRSQSCVTKCDNQVSHGSLNQSLKRFFNSAVKQHRTKRDRADLYGFCLRLHNARQVWDLCEFKVNLTMQGAPGQLRLYSLSQKKKKIT